MYRPEPPASPQAPAAAPGAARINGRRDTLVFDLDGVLVDVTQSFRRAIAATVAALGGAAVDDAAIQSLKNQGGFNNDWDLTRELLRRQGREVGRTEVMDAFHRRYRGANWDGLILHESWLLDADLLAACDARHRLAIFTGRPRADAEFTLRRFGVRDRFAAVLAMEDVHPGKPAPDGLVELRRRFAPEALAAYIGDTVDDARCAAAAGVPFLGIAVPGQPWTHELTRLFHAAGCALVAGSVGDACRRLLAQEPSASAAARTPGTRENA